MGVLNVGLAALAGRWLNRETTFGWYPYTPCPGGTRTICQHPGPAVGRPSSL